MTHTRRSQESHGSSQPAPDPLRARVPEGRRYHRTRRSARARGEQLVERVHWAHEMRDAYRSPQVLSRFDHQDLDAHRAFYFHIANAQRVIDREGNAWDGIRVLQGDPRRLARKRGPQTGSANAQTARKRGRVLRRARTAQYLTTIRHYSPPTISRQIQTHGCHPRHSRKWYLRHHSHRLPSHHQSTRFPKPSPSPRQSPWYSSQCG